VGNRYLLIRNDSFIFHGVIKKNSAEGKNDPLPVQIGLRIIVSDLVLLMESPKLANVTFRSSMDFWRPSNDWRYITRSL